MTINVSIDRKFEDNFDGYYPVIKVEVPDNRFTKIEKVFEKKITSMLEVDPFRTSGRTMINVDELGSNFGFSENFQLVVDFVEMKGEIKFKSSNRGYSRMIF